MSHKAVKRRQQIALAVLTKKNAYRKLVSGTFSFWRETLLRVYETIVQLLSVGPVLPEPAAVMSANT